MTLLSHVKHAQDYDVLGTCLISIHHVKFHSTAHVIDIGWTMLDPSVEVPDDEVNSHMTQLNILRHSQADPAQPFSKSNNRNHPYCLSIQAMSVNTADSPWSLAQQTLK
jgi:hypothetical protein